MTPIEERRILFQDKFIEMFGERVEDKKMIELISILLAIAENGSMKADPSAFESFKQCVQVLMYSYNLTEDELERFFLAVKLNGRPVN